MKKVFLFAIVFGILFVSFKLISSTVKPKPTLVAQADYSSNEKFKAEINKVKKRFGTDSNYNSEVVFMIDMSIPSMRNRFFIYDLKKDSIIDRGLVAHGSGSETGINGKLKFSNINKSLSTSLGAYSIGYSYQGKFGKAYKLYGLDDSNSNAFSRNIVLHKYWNVPYEEQKNYICNSYGCPMVNEIFYSRIQKIIDNSDKKIILSIYYE